MTPGESADNERLTIDERGRPEPPIAADETGTLLGCLDFHRATFAWKCSGLGSEGLNARTASSTMTLGGKMKHLALVEDGWLARSLFGRDYSPPWNTVDWKSDPDWEWRTAVDDSPEELRALWEDAVGRSRQRVEEALADGGSTDSPSALSLTDGRPASAGSCFT